MCIRDRSYSGQILVSTFPLIGNYGVIPPDFESDRIHVKGYIVGRWCQTPSNFRSEGSLDAFLKAQKVPGLYGIDTRELTKIIRESGVMNGTITRDPKSVDLAALRSYLSLIHISPRRAPPRPPPRAPRPPCRPR